MRFKDPNTGRFFENIESARKHFCCHNRLLYTNFFDNACLETCPLSSKNFKGTVICDLDWLSSHPTIAARLMGYEVIEYENMPNPTGRCDQRTKDDLETNPAYYTKGGIECIYAIKAAVEGLKGIEAFCVGNVIKYIWRYDQKNGETDLEKAAWYIKKLKGEIENG